MDDVQRRALTNGGIAALVTMVIGFVVVAATSDGETASTTPTASPTETPSPTVPSCAPSWEVVPSADPFEASNALVGVAALAAGEAWAVGSLGLEPGSPDTVLIERWDGLSWSAVEAPSPGSETNELLAVDASGPNDVWAVGRTASGFGDRPLALRYDGTAWLAMDLPDDVTGVLTGVAAIAPDDVWVVGFTGDPAAFLERAILLHWDGALWANLDAERAVGGGKSLLRDVDAAAPDDAWAVGYRHNRPLIIRFDGEAWSRSETAVAGLTTAVEAVTPTEAWAVGSPVQRFDGLAWTQAAAVPGDGQLLGVAAVAPGDVWAVGVRQRESRTRSLVFNWNGQRWRPVEGPGIPGADALAAVDALSDGTVLAVGYRDVAAGRRTLAVRGTTCPAES